MSEEAKQGAEHRRLGKSIHYNPYRHKGTPKQYTDWRQGYERAKAADKDS